jgi:hypothetical protein
VIFGEPLGELADYEEWLSQLQGKMRVETSSISGKPVYFALNDYCKDAKFLSFDEVKPSAKYEPLNINEIKDIDSILNGLREQFEYTGNRFLGNSNFVESSDIVLDSQFIYNSTNIEQSSYIYSSYMMRRGSKHVFGSGWTANGEFLLRVVAGIDIHRCFESHFIGESSDLFFCFNCNGCHNMLFSFGQRNKGHLIGNLALPKDKFAELKAKLLSEAFTQLRADKRFPSLFQLVPNKTPTALPKLAASKLEHGDMRPIEKGFSSTYEVMLKRKPISITALESWLGNHTVRLAEARTPFGDETYTPLNHGIISEMPNKRLVTIEESFELGKIALDETSISSLDKIIGALDKIAFFSAEFITGENHNIIKSPLLLSSANIYKGYEATYSENTGLTSLSLHSKNVYGCHRIIESQFCLKCYNSLYLNRCFELDACLKCADSYFCHNSEALGDCMFCFNAKGKRHAIGNNELELVKYKSVKDSVLEQIADELEKKKSLHYDIFNIGAKG